jgi:alanine dehydrogenase
MIIGIPKEVKDHEYRVGVTPAMAKILVDAGHRLLVEIAAGVSVGFTDEEYTQAGAEVVASATEVWGEAEMIIKVKEPQAAEFPLMREGQIIFGYLHLAPDPEQTKALLDKKVIAIAYETVTDAQGGLPLLQPMSEIAGRVAIQAGATALQMAGGGRGVLLGGVPGVIPGKVVIIGGGVVGTEAARMAMGLGADVVVLDRNLNRLRELDILFHHRLKTLYSTSATITEAVLAADLVIGAVLIPGSTAPSLVKRDHVERMQIGSVIVDVAIDQGGCMETAKPTTLSNPTYVVNGVVHYCVTNMPAACARTATLALTHATLDYALAIANKGYRRALRENPHLLEGLNVCKGNVTNRAVATDLGYTFEAPETCVEM